MPNATTPRAFSLVEVIIAVGLFAASVSIVLGLLPSLTRHNAEVQDSLTAQRLPDMLRIELQRLSAVGGIDALATRAPVLGVAPGDGLGFVSRRDGARLHARDNLPPAAEIIPDGEQYFVVECWRFPDEPLRFDAQKHFLALAVRVSWPYRLPGAAAPTADSARMQVRFAVSIGR